MKIKIEDMREINVTVKGIYRDRANKDDLMSFLNELSIVYRDAADYNSRLGCNAIAKDYKEKGDLLYKLCEEMGAYKGL